MSAFESLLNGFANALTLTNLGWSLFGVTLGTFIGILPGIGPALTIALLLPVTKYLDPTAAFIMFGGLYYGAMYGSSTTSILLNTPGESGSIITAIEGNVMARKGRGAAALSTAAIGSFIAGAIGTVLLTFFAPIVVKLAIAFGPAEYFALMLFAFTTASAMLGSSIYKGLTSLALGIALGLIGIDELTGQARLTFGYAQLLDGIDIVVVAVGLFAVGEALYVASQPALREVTIEVVKDSLWMSKEDWKRSWKPWLRGTALGFPFGALPAGGTEIPTFLSYFFEKKLSKNPAEFGHGAIEGCGRTGSSKQCGCRRRARATPCIGPAYLGHGCHPACCIPGIWAAARTAALHILGSAGLDADCEPVHWQRHAARSQPAAGWHVGAAAAHSPATALWRHSGVLDTRRLQREPFDL